MTQVQSEEIIVPSSGPGGLRPSLDEIGIRIAMGLRSRGIWAWVAHIEPPLHPDAVHVVVPLPRNGECFYQVKILPWQLREHGLGGIVARRIRWIVSKERRRALAAVADIVRTVPAADFPAVRAPQPLPPRRGAGRALPGEPPSPRPQKGSRR